MQQTFSLNKLYHWFHRYYERFYSSDEEIMRMVKLKEDHSLRVAHNACELAKDQQLPEQLLILAEAAGLLHDLARSEQAHLRTFHDGLTFDHGDRAVFRLMETGILNSLSPEERDIILFAIQYHNKMTVPESSSDKQLIANIIRDADKLDIFRILPLPTETSHQYSSVLIDLLLRGKPLPYREVKTPADKRLIRLGWLFDLNYPWAMRQLIDEGYPEQLLQALPDTPELLPVKSKLMAFCAKYSIKPDL